ncbi:MAG: SulP family inorganic anion transporter [Anaerolineae bacterium]
MADTPGGLNPFRRQPPTGGVARWVPGIKLLRTYRPTWLGKDIGAGLVLTAVLAPVGMGYAGAAGLPAVYGLYATMMALVAYAIFGPSRILVVGPDSAVVAIIAATIVPLAASNMDQRVALAGMLALLSGGLCLIAGLSRVAFVSALLSKPVRVGYLNGIALTVLIGQLPKLLGFPVSGDNLIAVIVGLAQGILADETNRVTLFIGLASLLILFGFKRWLPRAPGVLVAVVVATAATRVFDLAASAGVSVVGPLPQGLPSFQLPLVARGDLGALAAGAAAIALVSFAGTSVLSRALAVRNDYRVDENQELVALGAANIVVGLFQGFSISSTLSRTPVAEAAGAKTQVTGIVSAACIAGLLIFAPGLLQNLPNAVLSAVVIAAVVSFIDLPAVARFYRLRRSEFVFSLVCFLGVAFIGVIQGMLIAIGLSLLVFIWHAWRPYNAVLGRVDGWKGYHDVSRHPEARRIPGLVLFRWDAPLFFANADIFHEQALRAVADAPTATHWLVIAAEPVTDIDITAADVLSKLDDELQAAGIELAFAELKGPAKDRLKQYGLFTKLGDDLFFRTIGQAVDGYLAANPVEWRDWEDDRLIL